MVLRSILNWIFYLVFCMQKILGVIIAPSQRCFAMFQ